MADEILGITGVVNIDDIKNSFEGLISNLERVGAKTDELSAQMTKALSDIASSNGGDKASKAMEVLRSVIAAANKELGETPLMIANASKEVANIEKAITKLEEKQGKTIVGSPDFNSINKQLDNERQALQVAKEDVKDLTDSQSAAQQSVSSLLEMYGKLAGVINDATKAKGNINDATENEKRSIKELRDEYKQYQKDIQKINDELGNLNSVRAKLQKKVTYYQSKSDTLAARGATKTGYDSQSADYRNSLNELDNAKKKLEEIDTIQARLNSDLEQYTNEAKEVKDAIDNYGNDAKIKTPITEYRSLRNEIIALSMEYKNMSDAERSSAAGQEMKQKLDDLKEKAAELKQQMNATNMELKNEASPTDMFQGVSQGLSLLVSGFATAEGAASALGLSEKDLAEVQTMLQTSLAANNFLTETRTALLKSSALMLTINTVQEWASQKAIDAETAAKGRGVVATAALTLAQKAFNLVANANPYVLLATALLTVVGAVAGLVVAYKKHKAAAEEAAKAEEEKKAKIEAAKAANEEFASTMAKSAAQQIVSYQKLRREWSELGDDMNAKKKFITDNQDAFHQLGFSVNGFIDAEKLLVNNTDSVVNALILRAKAAAYEQRITDLTAEKIKKQEQIVGKYKKSKTGDKVNSYDIPWAGLVEGEDYIQNKDKVADYTLLQQGVRKLNKKKNNDAYKEQQRQRSEVGKEYDTAIGNAVKGLYSTQKKLATTLSSAGFKTYTPPKNTPENKTNNTNDDKEQEAQQDALERLGEMSLSLRRKNQQDEISLMEEGTAKKLAQIDYDYQEEIDAIKKKAEEIANLNKTAKTPNADQTLELDDGTRLSGLTSENVAELSASVDNADQKRDNATNEAYKERYEAELEAMREYMRQYGDEQQKYVALIEEWDKKIAEAKTEGERKSAEAGKKQAVDDFKFEQLQKSPEYTRAFKDLGQSGTGTLNYLLQQFQDALSNQSIDTSDPEKLQKYVSVIQQLQDELDNRDPFTALKKGMTDLSAATEKRRKAQAKITKLEKEGKKGTKEYAAAVKECAEAEDEENEAKTKISKSIDTVNDAIDQLAGQISSLGDTIGGKAGEILGFIGNILTFATTVSDSIKTIGTATATAMGTIEKASAILAIIQAVIQLMQMLNNLMPGDAHAKYEKYAEKLAEINTLRDAVNDYKIAVANARAEEKEWFSGSSLRNLKDYADAGIKAYDAYNAKLNETQATYVNESGGGWGVWLNPVSRLISPLLQNTALVKNKTLKYIGQLSDLSYDNSTSKAIDNLRIETRKASKGFLGSGLGGHSQKTEDLRTWVKNNLGLDLFDEEGWLNTEAYEVIMDKYEDKLVGETKETLEALKEYKDQYDEYIEKLEEYVSDLYQPLVENFTDALWDWFDDGKSALDSFKDYAGETFRDIVTDMMQSIMLSDFIDDFSETVKGAYKDYSEGKISNDNLMKTVVDATELAAETYEKNLPVYQELLSKYSDMLEQYGIDLSESSSSQSSSYGEASSITQDQASEISGRLTAIQWNGEQRLQYAIQQTALMTTVQLDTTHLRQMQENIRGYVSELVDIQQDSLNNLQKIVVNTNPLPGMKVTLDDIYKKIKNL